MEGKSSRCCGLWRFVDAFNSALGRAVSALVVLVTLLGAANAVLRYAGRFTGSSLSSNAWLELQWYLFALIFLLGAAVTLREDAHVRVDVVYHRLPPRRRAWINILGTVLFLIPFCVLMIWSSWAPVRNSWAIWEASPDPGGLPRWPIKTAIPVAFLLLLAQGASDLARSIAVLRGARAEESPQP
ncbi:MAG TPA: TRAP transporter small permease subunit [Kiritimatiellia bacterium]|nr:TRAP transporter small permease subunit [Kiritimatiellia bacterium]